MAYVRIKPIKTGTYLQASIDYIENPDKTEEMLYIASYMCDTRSAAKDFAEIYRCCAMHKGNNLAHHIIQSYSPEDNVTPEMALAIAQELMRRMYPNYQYVVAIHTDREHLHAHIIVNAVDFENYRKLHSNVNSLRQMRQISDDLCRENGLSVIPEDTIEKKKVLAQTIDRCIEQADTFDDYISLMQKAGYEVRIGKYISYRGNGYERFRRGDTIGNAYSEISIRQRINGIEVRRGKKRIYDDKTIRISNKNRVKYAIDDALKACKTFDEFVAMLVNNGMEIKQGKHLAMKVPAAKKFVRVEKLGIEYSETMLRLFFDDRAEYERIKSEENPKKIEKLAKNAEYNKYAAVQNINIQIRMINMLGEYGIKTYEELTDKMSDLERQEKALDENIKLLKAKIDRKKSIICSVRGYWRLKPVYEKYKSIKSPSEKELFSVEHSLELREYEKVTEIMNNSKLPDGHLPKADSLNAEILADEQKIAELKGQIGNIKAELRNFRTLKDNIDRISGNGPEEEREEQKTQQKARSDTMR